MQAVKHIIDSYKNSYLLENVFPTANIVTYLHHTLSLLSLHSKKYLTMAKLLGYYPQTTVYHRWPILPNCDSGILLSTHHQRHRRNRRNRHPQTTIPETSTTTQIPQAKPSTTTSLSSTKELKSHHQRTSSGKPLRHRLSRLHSIKRAQRKELHMRHSQLPAPPSRRQGVQSSSAWFSGDIQGMNAQLENSQPCAAS